MFGRGHARRTRRSRDAEAEVEMEVVTAGVADACQAYLSGSYRQLLEESGQAVPAWAWINRLAHGDRSSIEALAVAPDDGTPAALVASVARMLLVVSGRRGRSLVSVQQQRLIPLEERLASASAGDVPADQDDLARALATVLASW